MGVTEGKMAAAGAICLKCLSFEGGGGLGSLRVKAVLILVNHEWEKPLIGQE